MDVAESDVPIDVELGTVELLVRAQCPQLADQSITLIATGWDNLTFRIGEKHAGRFPRRVASVALTEHEHEWLPELAAGLPIPVPLPVHRGEPSPLFPWPWTVVEWFEGETIGLEGLDASQAERLARFLRQLHQPAPPNAPTNPYRGTPLAARAETVEKRLTKLGLERMRPIWDKALLAPLSEERRWMHGDLHPNNVLAHNGELAAIIDWGDLNAGDEATDLACAWMLFEGPPRTRFLEAYAPDEALLTRATGWAVNFASGLTEWGDPRLEKLGVRTGQRLLSDAERGLI